MMTRAALCIDEATRLDPSTIGLAGESLEDQGWLEVFLSGVEARAALALDGSVDRVWVISCDDVEPINLAASLKADRPELLVSLVQPEAGGSVLSRAHNASIDEVIEPSVFVRGYGELKGRNAALEDSVVVQDVQAGQRVAAVQEHPSAQMPEPRQLAIVEQQVRRTSAIVQLDTFVMPVVSGSGGAGKSAVSVVAAHLAHRMGYRTLLLDYDLQFGDAAMLSGIENPVTIDEAFAHPDLVDREIERNDGPVVLAAPERLESAELVVRALPEHLDSIVSKFDVVVANTGAAWAEQHAALLERSNAALFLVDQRVSSIRACRHALELCARCGIATGQFQFALNRCAKGAPLTSIDVSCALRGVPVFELSEGGPDVEELLGSGSPHVLVDAKNEFALSLGQLLSKVLPGAEGRQVGDGGLEDGRSSRFWSRDDKRRGRHAGRRRTGGKQ